MAKRTIAVFTLVLPKGERHNIRYDFGEDYPEEKARYMFFKGNYSCDCNRSLMIDGLAEFECGDTISLENFNIEYEEN